MRTTKRLAVALLASLLGFVISVTTGYAPAGRTASPTKNSAPATTARMTLVGQAQADDHCTDGGNCVRKNDCCGAHVCIGYVAPKGDDPGKDGTCK